MKARTCELRPGIGLCDLCQKPNWPQEYIGLGMMWCVECIDSRALTPAEEACAKEARDKKL